KGLLTPRLTPTSSDSSGAFRIAIPRSGARRPRTRGRFSRAAALPVERLAYAGGDNDARPCAMGLRFLDPAFYNEVRFNGAPLACTRFTVCFPTWCRQSMRPVAF